MVPKENKHSYASETQRNVLVSLFRQPLIGEHFFLTGGTALSVFYLHHRTSNDLDLFTLQNIELPEIDFWIRRTFSTATKIRQSDSFLCFIIDETKVDFVKDPLSIPLERPKILLEENSSVQIDTISNIVSNKLTTLASRTEPKDFIDFYFICKKYPKIVRETILLDAIKKDAIFDDPPTAAFQIEEGFKFVLKNTPAFPYLLTSLDYNSFNEFYKKFIAWLYKKGLKGSD